jgi:hypothetical protein
MLWEGVTFLMIGVGMLIGFAVVVALMWGLANLIGMGWAILIVVAGWVLFLMWDYAGRQARREKAASFYVTRKEKV